MLLTFGEGGDYGGGYSALAECDEDSGAIGVSLHRGDTKTTNCNEDSLITVKDDIYGNGSCTDSKIRRCTTTGKVFCFVSVKPLSYRIFTR